jgi:hypothetical protein
MTTRMITANPRTTANLNARLSCAMFCPPGTRAHFAISNFRGENCERCVNYFTLARK